MEIEFRTSKLKKCCENLKAGTRKWGRENAEKVLQRLNEIEAAEDLEMLLKLPGAGCHALKQDRDGQYSVYLKHPYRLIFEPSGDPSGYIEENNINPARVTQVLVLEVEDYHG